MPQLVRRASQGLAPVADRVLLLRRELRHGPGLALWDEPGVVAEAPGPVWLEADPALAGPDAGHLLPLGRHQDGDASVPGGAPLGRDPVEGRDQLGVVVLVAGLLSRVAGRL